MSDRYSFLALEDDFRLVLTWFEALPGDPVMSEQHGRLIYYFRDQARAPLPAVGDINQEKTPLVILTNPRKVRRSLWTDAEVFFTPTPFKRQFPSLYKISKSFSAWLGNFDLVFSAEPSGPQDWLYYLEGGTRNANSKLFALPRAMEALRGGQYFVHHRDNELRLDALARSLRLRGYDVAGA